MKKILFLIPIIIVFALIVWISFSQFFGKKLEVLSEEESLVPSAPVIEPVTNPLEGEILDVNPATNTNPFSDTYKNPFE